MFVKLQPILKECFVFAVFALLFSGCGTSTKFAARKYTKGYFVDVAGAIPKVASREVKHSVTKQIVSTPTQKVAVPVQLTTVSSSKICSGMLRNIKGDSIRPQNESKSKPTHYSIASGFTFLGAIGVFIGAVALERHIAATSTALNAGLSVLGIGALVTLIIDIIAVALAINAFSNHEKDVTIAGLVLALDFFFVLIMIIIILV